MMSLSEIEAIIPAPVASPKQKSSLFPVLVFLFVLSYALLTLLVIEQGRTIQSQRAMIHVLLSDSAQLSHLKQEIRQQRSTVPTAKAPAESDPQLKGDKMRESYPYKLPKGIKDNPDVRRRLFSI